MLGCHPSHELDFVPSNFLGKSGEIRMRSEIIYISNVKFQALREQKKVNAEAQ